MSSYPEQRATARTTLRDLLIGKSLGEDELLALAEFAASVDRGGRPFAAIGFTEGVARWASRRTGRSWRRQGRRS